MSKVVVVIGAGSIGQAIARRVSTGKHVVLADLRQENADAATKVLLDAGFDVSTTTVDVSSRASVRPGQGGSHNRRDQRCHPCGRCVAVAGVSGNNPAVDLYGTAVVLEEFGNVIAEGGSAWSSPPSPGTGWAR